MPQLTDPITPEADALRADWVARTSALINQLAEWAAAEGWPTKRLTETITERRLGTYDAPSLKVYPPNGQLWVTPVALDLLGRSSGRIDVTAIPTLSRVMLLGQPDGTWQIMTDSNIPVRLPWTRETFVQLAADLLA